MREDTKYAGLDVHKETIAVAVADGERGGEVRYLGSIAHEDENIRRLAKKLSTAGATLQFCYEAGPCGYGLQRHIEKLDHLHRDRAVDDAASPRRAGEDRSA